MQLSLIPKQDVLLREIESWKGFADALSKGDKELFLKMLQKLHHYSTAINSKAKPFPTEPLIMALVLDQHRLIQWLTLRMKPKEYQESQMRCYRCNTFLITRWCKLVCLIVDIL